MEAKGKYDFTATAAGDLNFKKDDVFKILSTHGEWYKAEMLGHEGFVPKSYVDLTAPGWFQEDATRGAAEQILSTKPVGAFVIRGCQSSPGNFSISVKHECDVQHFKVIRDERGHYFLWAERFTSLNKLVDFYKTTSISKTTTIFLNADDFIRTTPGTQTAKVGRLPKQQSIADFMAAAAARPVTDQPQHSHMPRGRGSEERMESVVQSERRSPTGATQAPDSAHLHQKAKPPPPQQVLALYDFSAEEDDEMSFRAGDVINITDASNPAWWTGRCGGRRGLFPANYTKPL